MTPKLEKLEAEENTIVHQDGQNLPPEINNNLSELTTGSNIVNFYSDRSILITGGSGFIGKVIIEKLLRNCASIKYIFVLIRPKRNKQPASRLQELLEEPLFDGVRKDPELLGKVVAVEGDVGQVNLGLSEEDLATINDHVSVVYHAAATVKFDAPLKEAVSINLVGTKNIVELCRELPQLVALVHVSTAYANCELQEINEHVYPVNMSPGKLIELASWMDQDTLQELKDKLIASKPNTYTYTKALGEWFLAEEASDLPVVICRPSIICSSWKEPFSGWIDGLNGPTGLTILGMKGLIRSLFGNPTSEVHLVPVDSVINMIIALGWFAQLHQNFKHLKRSAPFGDKSPVFSHPMDLKLDRLSHNTRMKLKAKNLPERLADVPVFNCTNSELNPLTWQMFSKLAESMAQTFPASSLYRYPSFEFTDNVMLDKFYKLTLHDIPGYAIDWITKLAGGKPKLTRILGKFRQSDEVLRPFYKNHWKFSAENRLMLNDELMSEEDKQLFNCDTKSLVWAEYLKDYVLGIRKFILKEPVENLEQARSNLKMVYYRNACLQVLIFASIVVSFWSYLL